MPVCSWCFGSLIILGIWVTILNGRGGREYDVGEHLGVFHVFWELPMWTTQNRLKQWDFTCLVLTVYAMPAFLPHLPIAMVAPIVCLC